MTKTIYIYIYAINYYLYSFSYTLIYSIFIINILVLKFLVINYISVFVAIRTLHTLAASIYTKV